MSTLKNEFEISLKNYTGSKKELLSVDHFTSMLLEELPVHFKNWMNPELTGEPAIEPISKIGIEVDSAGYVYSSLYSEKGLCMVSEGSSPNLFDWGLVSVDEEDYAFEKRQNLIAQFLALCYKKALPKACKSQEFLNLPRAEKVLFSVGAHSGWECDELYTYEGERNEIDYGNIRLKRLHNAAYCYTQPGTIENKFMNHLNDIDIHKCSDELIPVFKEFLSWLSEQQIKPVDRIAIAWSSNFDKESAFGGISEKTVYKWPSTFNFSKWFSNERPKNLDDDNLTSVRHAVTNKIAEIACLAAESFTELDVFKNLSKTDQFIMRVQNRTAGAPPIFYPFK
ncbi:hypothetical protein [Aquimarina sp. 2201CG5-10]|uniref:hypothetical protein n=1 Tax=Aquimarina callyspongiae TaxID=3098150 RepID=UPI002AB38A95|nr:hypothetical protein [Aquimarina sp. 2201CG5-10]MDY8137485.1 hypothetical protein [Aquimarina sp. 2201CG5-10]